jgi:hypothetical protein
MDPLIFTVPVKPVVSVSQTGLHDQQCELLSRELHKGVLACFDVNREIRARHV